MSEKPILIIQMQRMGDIILSFPTCAWLSAQYPKRKIFVLAEEIFFSGLLNVSPDVTYLPYGSKEILSMEFSLILNLSHRPEAAELCGCIKAEEKIGPYLDSKMRLRINGPWQIYRSSILHNNRLNLFHWADLNALDVVPEKTMRTTRWPEVQKNVNQGGRVGLFIGASEANKRPEPLFWSTLATDLINMGLRPILLGGKADKPVAARITSLLKAPSLNLCGRFSLTELCSFMHELDLLVVPDTGPMHLGTWIGVPLLNLSMGSVNAWETGPMAPGRFVLRSSISCVGCWECTQKDTLCKKSIRPHNTAKICADILAGKDNFEVAEGNTLLCSNRDTLGLFDLSELSPLPSLFVRKELAMFWKHFFLTALTGVDKVGVKDKALNLPQKLKQELLADLTRLLGQTSLALRRPEQSPLQQRSNWVKFIPALRPLSSFIHCYSANALFTSESIMDSIQMLELASSYLRIE